jgi:hypothetical protein
MASDVKQIYAAEPLATGAIRVAPLGTAAPTSATSALNASFVDLGYVGADGFVEKNDRKTDNKRAFGGKVVKVLQSEFNATVEVTLLESTNAEVLKAVFGSSNVTVTDATAQHGVQVTVKKNSKRLPHMSWVIDTTDSEMDAFYRNYIPDGKVTSVGDIKIVHTDTIEYKLVIECFEDANGDNIVTFTDDGQKSGS